MHFRAALLLTAILAACSPQPSAEATPSTQDTQPARHAQSGLALVPVSVVSATGEHRFRAELAASPEEQRRGLMFRTELGPNEAMIFPNNPPQVRSFWMHNTVIPLDIIYIGPDRRIVNIVRGEPYDDSPLPSAGPVINVLEIAAGRAAELGIKSGDLVNW